MADLTGKHAIVTGATNGIGEVTALELAARGATVTVVSRSEDKCRRTAALIDRETGSEANYIQADLSSIDDTRRAAAAYRDRFERLDILVNNAGAGFTELKESVDGIELTQALNHLGYFVLTAGLLDLIKATAAAHPAWGARIVNVSSGAHRSGANWDDPLFEENYTPFAAYGQSKAFNIMFTYDLA
ncbi:MAG: SDR family NAD(P)-dependent oxidoreductase, partial [Chloroflexi bacterium]|nr:SDR family NAD(P)-dependent oxidoreductase [Chloroflexota bacterium]